MARVREVIFDSSSFSSTLRVSGRMSMKTGLAPWIANAFALETKAADGTLHFIPDPAVLAADPPRHLRQSDAEHPLNRTIHEGQTDISRQKSEAREPRSLNAERLDSGEEGVDLPHLEKVVREHMDVLRAVESNCRRSEIGRAHV